MSKFNAAAEIPMTTNHEGHIAYQMPEKEKLVTQVLTSFFNENKFYGDNSGEIEKTILNVIQKDPEFISNLAMFARREFNMRSVSHVLTAYLAHEENGKPYVKKTVKNIVLRGDDATEILAFYMSKFGKPIPNSLRKALRDIFITFDPYALAKYKGEGKTVKMRDILCLCHPSPKDQEQSDTWKKLLEGKLEPAYTWETELSEKGNTREVWESLIDSGRLPYMAMLRNIRNIWNCSPKNIDLVAEHISDPEAVRHSRQLPFRYLSAYRSLTECTSERYADKAFTTLLEALEKAADISVDNIPKIPGKTVIAIDVSGSMGCAVSRNSNIQCCDISMLLGVIANRICEESIVYTFNNSILPIFIPKRDGILGTAARLATCHGGTNMHLPFEQLMKNKIDCDRMIIISDNECNSRYEEPVANTADQYRRTTGNNIWVHAIDLQGYGTQQFAGARTNIIAGWSEKVFEFISLAERGTESLMKRIGAYSPKAG